MNKRNNGFITKITVGDKLFEIDGYVMHDVMKSLLSWKALQALDWTNNLGKTELVLSEACFFENRSGDIFEVEFEDIDVELRQFDNCLKLAKAIEAFVKDI